MFMQSYTQQMTGIPVLTGTSVVCTVMYAASLPVLGADSCGASNIHTASRSPTL